MRHIAPTMTTAKGEKFSTFISNFADDTAMMIGNLKDMETVVSAFPPFLADFGVEVHTSTKRDQPSKSSIIHIPANKEQKMACQNNPVRINGNSNSGPTWVTFQTSARYLGAIISSTLKDNAEIRGRIQKAVALFGSLRKIFSLLKMYGTM